MGLRELHACSPPPTSPSLYLYFRRCGTAIFSGKSPGDLLDVLGRNWTTVQPPVATLEGGPSLLGYSLQLWSRISLNSNA
jgi:hypothetical protein